MVWGTGTWTPNYVPGQGGSPTWQVSSENHSTATASGTATTPSARKNANSPAVKNTTIVIIDSSYARLISVPGAPNCIQAKRNAHNAIEPNPR
jgi:hypothetical protein